MKSTSSTSSSSSREEKAKSPPRLTVSDHEEQRLLSVSVGGGGSTGNISRKSSKTSLKSATSDSGNNDNSNNTKQEIIASMIKDKMKELQKDDDDAVTDVGGIGDPGDSPPSSLGVIASPIVYSSNPCLSSSPGSSSLLASKQQPEQTATQETPMILLRSHSHNQTASSILIPSNSCSRFSQDDQKLLNHHHQQQHDTHHHLHKLDRSNSTSVQETMVMNKLTLEQRPSTGGKKRHSSSGWNTAQLDMDLDNITNLSTDNKRASRESFDRETGGGSESEMIQPQSLNVSSCSSTGNNFNVTPKIATSSTRKYSRSHQMRFHRRFPAVDADEKLIDFYNCALVAEILLQGYLYISDNYFAFYSNIFGYKTQILIPVSDVVSVTKEKTAKIFPNAVGICTGMFIT